MSRIEGEDTESEDLEQLLKEANETLNFIPFDEETTKELKKEAKALGWKLFIEKHYSSKTSLMKLMYAFDFEVELWHFEEMELWPLFSRLLRKYCERRDKLPGLNTIDQAIDLINISQNIIVLTGAGISVSCGIPDFRSNSGLYAQIAQLYPELDDPHLMFDIHFFNHNPKPFFQLAKKLYPQEGYKPSKTHYFIKELEKKGKLLRNYTQNIDTLEKEAGIDKVICCHGSFETFTCLKCGYKSDGHAMRPLLMTSEVLYCPICTSQKEDESDSEEDERLPVMKPDITFFGEKLPHLFDNAIEEDKLQVDLLIVIGSSLKVSPVADLVGFFPHKVPLILINREPVFHLHHSMDIHLFGYCDDIVTYLQQKLGWSDGQVSEPEFVIPNIYLFNGAVFDKEKYKRLLDDEWDGYSTSSESETENETETEAESVNPL